MRSSRTAGGLRYLSCPLISSVGCGLAPAATGISRRPTAVRKRQTIRARVCELLPTVVTPRKSSSGLASTRASAKASSMSVPISVSSITGTRLRCGSGFAPAEQVNASNAMQAIHPGTSRVYMMRSSGSYLQPCEDWSLPRRLPPRQTSARFVSGEPDLRPGPNPCIQPAFSLGSLCQCDILLVVDNPQTCGLPPACFEPTCLPTAIVQNILRRFHPCVLRSLSFGAPSPRQ